MKKVLCLFLIFSTVIFCACSNQISDIVLNNMSDLRTNFFVGENDIFYAELSCGTREEYFFYDGVSTNKVDCGVLSIGFFEIKYFDAIQAQVEIDGQTQNVVLQHSPFEEMFMVDIGKKIDDNSKVSIVYDNQKVDLKCVSKDWQVDYKRAINIGITNLQSKLDNLYFNGKLNAEGYLKIVYEKEFNKTYWYFGIIDRADNKYNLLIDVNDGRVIYN